MIPEENGDVKIICSHDKIVHPKSLKFYQKNRNSHTDEQILRLRKSFHFWGIYKPLIVDPNDNTVVAGNGRLRAALDEGLSQVPIQYKEFANDDERHAFHIADNASTKGSELDMPGINTDLPDLGPMDLDCLLLPDFKLDPSELPEKKKKVKICKNCGEEA